MLRAFFHRFLLVLILLYTWMIPFGYHLAPVGLERNAVRVLLPLQQWLFPGMQAAPEVSSDSVLAWIAFGCCILLAALAAVLWRWVSPKNPAAVASTAVRYFVALHLLIYGCSKLFKVQFYLPEPNTLYSTVGDTPRDLLYWTVMGLSRPYCVFLGILECVAAGLLLFRRTTAAGALLAVGILANIFAINLAFDISVKMHSGLLLLFAMAICWMVRSGWLPLFGIRPIGERPLPHLTMPPQLYWPVKLAVIALLLAESMYPFIRSGNFNDDRAVRPAYHGAYEVSSFVFRGDTLAPLLTDTIRWRRVFFHRQGYFITANMQDRMMDYEITGLSRSDSASMPIYHFQLDDPRKPTAQPVDMQLTKVNASEYLLDLQVPAGSIHCRLQRLNWEQLPALKKEFNWNAEGN